jgi:hypothetical protein
VGLDCTMRLTGRMDMVSAFLSNRAYYAARSDAAVFANRAA